MNGHELPPFRVIEAALRTTTERLVREVVDPRDSAPEWNEFEWAVARAVCAMQGISGLLATRLKWRGALRFHDFLQTQRAHTLRRDELVEQQLARLHDVLGKAGIPFVPLKGSALRLLRLHEPGERPQGDIDLLLHANDLAPCGEVLKSIDYRLSYSTHRHDVYVPASRDAPFHFGEHPENLLKLELHTRIAENLPVETVDITASICPVFDLPGAGSYSSLAALMRHLCLHAAGNMRANAARFLQIYEISLLAGRLAPADWRELLGKGDARAQAWWLFPPLCLAARYLAGSVPATVLEELRPLCPRRLRERYERVSIYEVSWSNLHIPALPGHEWARTPADFLRFARSRVWPGPTALKELAQIRVAAPDLMRVRWYGASHAERIARWLFSHTPRVQTISTVSAALEESAS
jgi:putative nucleotidyltransferase-like protein